MSKKIDQKAEKRVRNETYAERFIRDEEEGSETKKTSKNDVGLYANWCRRAGHKPSCTCVYSKIEIVARNQSASFRDCVNGKDCPNHPR